MEARPEPSTARRVAGVLGALVLGLVLLVAAGAKVLHPVALADQIVAEGLGGVIPAFPLAVLVLALEGGLGVALMLQVRHPLVLAPTTFMVIAFLLLTGRNYYRALSGTLPETSGCGCFGNLVERTPAEAFWGDLALLLIPLVLIFWAARGQARELPRGRLAAAALATLAFGALAAKAPELPVDDWATRLRPGVEVGGLCFGQDPRVCLTELVPELESGRHWVVLGTLDEALGEKVEPLNQALWGNDGAWELRVLTTQPRDEVDPFMWSYGPAFSIHPEIPKPLMGPLARSLPRSFEVLDGRVVATAAGWPPWLKGKP